MNTAALVAFVIEIVAVVAGQVLVKHAIQQAERIGFWKLRTLLTFFGGIAGMAVSFFLSLGLLQHFDLSYFFPLQASTTILIVMVAAIALRERLSLRLIAGTIVITIGIVVVSLT